MGDLDDSLALAARRIYAQHSAICAAPCYLEKHGTAIDRGPRQPQRDRLWPRRHCPALDRKACDGHVGKFVPRPRLVLGHGEPMLDAALAGGAWSLADRLVADSLKSGELETVLSACPSKTSSRTPLAGDAQPDAKSPRCRRRPDRAFFVTAMGCRMRWSRPPA